MALVVGRKPLESSQAPNEQLSTSCQRPRIQVPIAPPTTEYEIPAGSLESPHARRFPMRWNSVLCRSPCSSSSSSDMVISTSLSRPLNLSDSPSFRSRDGDAVFVAASILSQTPNEEPARFWNIAGIAPLLENTPCPYLPRNVACPACIAADLG